MIVNISIATVYARDMWYFILIVAGYTNRDTRRMAALVNKFGSGHIQVSSTNMCV